ncbi:SOS response-associated peptidase [Heyndrickxia sporothermodurans]
MCGRFTLTVTIDQIIDRFDIKQFLNEELFSPSFNIAPSQAVLTVINDGTKNRLGYLRWGLIPPWAKDEKIGYKMINARAETISEKPSFRNAYKKKRCLILADSFYEWKRHDNNTKTPMRIKLKAVDLFAMAGIWESWKSPNGQIVYTCSVITTASNELMSSIHDRMPVILEPDDEKYWLDPSISDIDFLHQFLKPFNQDMMEAYEVSTLVNSPKNNSPTLIQKIC